MWVAVPRLHWTDGARRNRAGWMLRLGLQPLARGLLPQRAAAAGVVRVLRDAIRHGGDQQLLLPAAQTGDVSGLARAIAGWGLLRGQGQPIYHAHQATQG